MKYYVLSRGSKREGVNFDAPSPEEAQRIALEKMKSKNPFAKKLESVILYELKERPQPFEPEYQKVWCWEKETGWELAEDEEYIYYPTYTFSKKTKEVVIKS